jgi:hypothetical protein
MKPHIFSSSALDGVEWSVSRLGRCTLADIGPGMHWKRVWVGLTAGVESVDKRNISVPGSPDSLVVHFVDQLLYRQSC